MRQGVVALLAAILVACGAATTSKSTSTTTVVRERDDRVQVGRASWYGGKHHGAATASGERFNKHALTAAHRRLRFGTRVRVTTTKTRRSVVVRINDRGPFSRGRIIDVSEAAAKKLGMIDAGVVQVKLEVLR